MSEKGIESFKDAVKKDCEKANCFNENGCNLEKSKCMHKYCDKYKWVIDRAKHYAEKTGKTFEEILTIWETDRTYWYMNYYQGCKQVLIQGDNVIMYNDWVKKLNERFGDKENWTFVCPACGHNQSVKDFREIGIDNGSVAFNCIGRYDKNKGGCDWSLGGLLQINTKNVIKDGKAFPAFEMAEKE